VGWNERKAVAADLRLNYRAVPEAEAAPALSAFESKWDRKNSLISKSWWTHWPELITFLKFPVEIRKVIYTTNAIESVTVPCVPSQTRLGAIEDLPSISYFLGRV
jgi:transposase-like protein